MLWQTGATHGTDEEYKLQHPPQLDVLLDLHARTFVAGSWITPFTIHMVFQLVNTKKLTDCIRLAVVFVPSRRCQKYQKTNPIPDVICTRVPSKRKLPNAPTYHTDTTHRCIPPKRHSLEDCIHSVIACRADIIVSMSPNDIQM